jgi:transposase-like protein
MMGPRRKLPRRQLEVELSGRMLLQRGSNEAIQVKQQIVGIPKEAEAGIAVKELSRKHGISDATFYNWKAKYGGRGVWSKSGCASWKRRTRG